jgi:sulfonate transport system substrate-binding protein
VDLLAKEQKHKAFDAGSLFDRRYERVAADAVAGERKTP